MAETQQRTKLLAHTPAPSTQTGGGCFVLFALQFIGVGILVMLLSLGYLHLGESRSENAPPWLLTIFGSVFATAGPGLAFMGASGMWRARRARKRKEDHRSSRN